MSPSRDGVNRQTFTFPFNKSQLQVRIAFKGGFGGFIFPPPKQRNFLKATLQVMTVLFLAHSRSSCAD